MSFAAVASAVVGVTGIAVGAANGAKAEKGIKNAMSKRKAFKTPNEVFEILNATENKSQGDTIARDFQMNQLDTSFADILGTAETLGADPNQLSSLFGQKLQGMLQVGDQFHKSNTESWGNYINALKLVGDNKAAEQISQDNIWKDYMQSLAKKKADANTTLNNGINSLLRGIGIYRTNKLYKNKSVGGGAGGEAEGNIG